MSDLTLIFQKGKKKLENEETQQLNEVQEKLDKVKRDLKDFTTDQLNEFEKDLSESIKILEIKLYEVNIDIAESDDKVSKKQRIEKDVIMQEKELEGNEHKLQMISDSIFDEDILHSYKNKKVELDELITISEDQKDGILKSNEILNFWKSAFSTSGIPSMLIDESIPFMNSRVSEYLDQISNGRYVVSFDTLSETKGGEFRDQISVNMFDNVTKASGKKQFSGGQTRIADIATILTLCDLQSSVRGISFNILLFDEIFDSLDTENTEFVAKVLRSLIKDKTICIISHRHLDQIEADETLNLC